MDEPRRLPDGQEIAFDLLGDIYTMPIAGGEAHALTTGIAWDMQPRYSPNGKRIAFTTDRGGGDNIWVMNRDGSNPRQSPRRPSACSTARLDARRQVHRRAQALHRPRSLGAGEMWLYHRSGAATACR